MGAGGLTAQEWTIRRDYSALGVGGRGGRSSHPVRRSGGPAADYILNICDIKVLPELMWRISLCQNVVLIINR